MSLRRSADTLNVESYYRSFAKSFEILFCFCEITPDTFLSFCLVRKCDSLLIASDVVWIEGSA